MYVDNEATKFEKLGKFGPFSIKIQRVDDNNGALLVHKLYLTSSLVRFKCRYYKF